MIKRISTKYTCAASQKRVKYEYLGDLELSKTNSSYGFEIFELFFMFLCQLWQPTLQSHGHKVTSAQCPKYQASVIIDFKQPACLQIVS